MSKMRLVACVGWRGATAVGLVAILLGSGCAKLHSSTGLVALRGDWGRIQTACCPNPFVEGPSWSHGGFSCADHHALNVPNQVNAGHLEGFESAG